MKRRLNYLDLAKGLLISLVVFHHIPYVLRNVDPSIYIEDMIKMEVFYTSFFMCAFFMITGMTFCPNGTLWTFVKKNFRALILPGILLAIINRITLSYLLGKELRIDIIGLLVRGGEYWFLTSLFCSNFGIPITEMGTVIWYYVDYDMYVCFCCDSKNRWNR